VEFNSEFIDIDNYVLHSDRSTGHPWEFVLYIDESLQFSPISMGRLRGYSH